MDITKEREEKNRFGTDVVVRISLDRDNLSKLLRYKDASAFERRTKTVQNINAVMSKVVEYIQETFTDDLITLNFNFSTPEGSQPCRTFKFPGLIGNLETDRLKLLVEQDPIDPNHCTIRHWYISDDGKESALITMETADRSSARIYYRGIRVKDGNDRYNLSEAFRIPGIAMRINIMCGRARDLLEINRDHFKPTSYSHVKGIIQDALKSLYRAAFEFLKPVKMDNTVALLSLRRFFLGNPCHTMIFYEILRSETVKSAQPALHADFERFSLGNEGKTQHHLAAVQQGGISSIGIIENQLFIDDMLLSEALSWAERDMIWYTDFAFSHTLTHSLILRHPSGQPLCAIEDHLSDMMGLYYRTLRIVQDNVSPREYVKLYTLAHDVPGHEYTEFHDGEHALMCRLILKRYIYRYLNETDPTVKNVVGNYILVLPAIQDFESIAVNMLPPEAPDELISHVRRFIVCLWSVEILAHKCATFEPETGIVRLDAGRMLAMVEEAAFTNSIKGLDYVEKQMNIKNRQDSYRHFFEYLDVEHVD